MPDNNPYEVKSDRLTIDSYAQTAAVAERTLIKKNIQRRWWAYFALSLVLWGLGGVLLYFIKGIPATTKISIALYWVCLIGLFYHLRSKALFVPLVWRICCLLLAAEMIYEFGNDIFAVWNHPDDPIFSIGITRIGTYLYSLPLIVALWRYASSPAFIRKIDA